MALLLSFWIRGKAHVKIILSISFFFLSKFPAPPPQCFSCSRNVAENACFRMRTTQAKRALAAAHTKGAAFGRDFLIEYGAVLSVGVFLVAKNSF